MNLDPSYSQFIDFNDQDLILDFNDLDHNDPSIFGQSRVSSPRDPVIWPSNSWDHASVSNNSYLASPPSHTSPCLKHLTSINRTSFMTSGTHSLYLTLKFPRLTWAPVYSHVQSPHQINMWCLLQEHRRLTRSTYIGFNFGTKC